MNKNAKGKMHLVLQESNISYRSAMGTWILSIMSKITDQSFCWVPQNQDHLDRTVIPTKLFTF